ncbi:hypothetical protein B1757_13295 [Acidithiobacillus marinus]|uniref:Uncharacterized protein n=1 Tax=Acidithiobacillus marinus TaxID=187490 RepID=A0A2I1DIS1_9PROT|nr:hypothetical protein [Acidithiobacillus marinus]PKY09770.1 hypothetical protein B1757_13295 [Acidithiobacillus marinus]
MRWGKSKKKDPNPAEAIDAVILDESDHDDVLDLDDPIDDGGKMPKAPRRRRVSGTTPGKTPVYIAAELSSGTVDIWRVTPETSEIVTPEHIPEKAIILRFTGNDLSISRKGKNSKAIKNELRVILNDNPVIKSYGRIAFATTKAELLTWNQRQAPGILVAQSAHKIPLKNDQIIGVYAEGVDSIAIAAYVEASGEIKGYAVSTDASEAGREEAARRAEQIGDGDIDIIIPKTWLKASSLSIPSKKLLSMAYPVDGEVGGKPATYWGGIGMAAGAAFLLATGAFLVTEKSQLAEAHSAMQKAMQDNGKGESEIRALLQKHVRFVESKSSVNLGKGITAARQLWQPGELATLSMSSGAVGGVNRNNHQPANGIIIHVTPFISKDGALQGDTVAWLPPKLLMTKIHRSAPKGYRISAVHMNPSGSRYEVVYEADKH